MDYNPGDIVEFNFNGCLWPDLPSAECEVLKIKPNSAGIYRLKLLDGPDPMLVKHLAMETENTFTCHQDWFRLAPGKSIPVDVSNLL